MSRRFALTALLVIGLFLAAAAAFLAVGPRPGCVGIGPPGDRTCSACATTVLRVGFGLMGIGPTEVPGAIRVDGVDYRRFRNRAGGEFLHAG